MPPAAKTWLTKLADTAGERSLPHPLRQRGRPPRSATPGSTPTCAPPTRSGTRWRPGAAGHVRVERRRPAADAAGGGVARRRHRQCRRADQPRPRRRRQHRRAEQRRAARRCPTPYDTAVARTKTSTGASMSVLLADSEITSILGSASAGSSAGDQFAAVQDFLAQTAMIVAEGPNTPPAPWWSRRRRAGTVTRRGRGSAPLTQARPGCARPSSARSPPRPRKCPRAAAEPEGERGRAAGESTSASSRPSTRTWPCSRASSPTRPSPTWPRWPPPSRSPSRPPGAAAGRPAAGWR